MKPFTSIKLSLGRAKVLSVLAVIILVLPVVLMAIRRQGSQTLVPNTPFHEPLRERVTSNLNRGKLCFLRDQWIYVKDLASGKETKLVEGVSPRLAPTGEYLLFLSITEKDGPLGRLVPPLGRLRLLKLQTMEISTWDSLRQARVRDAEWSSKSKIALVVVENDRKERAIAMLDPVTGKLEKKITADWGALIGDQGIYLDSWTPGNHSVLFHTLHALYEANFENGLIEKITVDQLFEKGGISSGTKFLLSSDRRYLLFDRMIDTTDEPQTQVISVYDFAARTLRRITPKNIQGSSAVWLNDQILFTKIDNVEEHLAFSICKINLDGTGLTTVVQNADYVSYAAK